MISFSAALLVVFFASIFLIGCQRQAGITLESNSMTGHFLVVQVGDKFDTIWGINLNYRGDTLVGEDSDTNYFSIVIRKIGKHEEVLMGRPWSITDSSYRPPRFETVEQSVLIKEEDNSSQATIFGKVLIFHAWPSLYIDTAIVSGTLSIPDK